MNTQPAGASAPQMIVIVLAVVGAIATFGVGATALMHGTMMGRMGWMGCR